MTDRHHRREQTGIIAPAEPAEELMVWEALNLALNQALEEDESVFVLGEDVGFYGGSYRVTQGLYARYGEWRVRDTPISENSFTGLGVGAAMAGGRPVVEIMTINFALLALDAIVNMAANMRYMSGGQFQVPLVIRMPGGVAHQLAAQHSQRLATTMLNTPGLRIVAPGTPQDSYWQLRQAVHEDDPVILLEHERLYSVRGPFSLEAPAPPLHAAAVRREGTDLTLVAWHRMVAVCLAAADALAAEGIEAEVIDLRSLRPFDLPALQLSLGKTHRMIIVEEDPRFAGVGTAVAAELYERSFFELDAPIVRLGAADVPIPYNRQLEDAALPRPEEVVRRARTICGRAAG